VGSLLSELKKKQRDPASYRSHSDAVTEELGDVLWYLAAVARRGGVALSAIAAHLYGLDVQWRGVDDPTLTLEALQPHPIAPGGEPTANFAETLLDLASDVGLLIRDFQAGRLEVDQALLPTRLAEILTRLLRASREAHLTLEVAAIKKTYKIFDRWPEKREYPEAFDADADADPDEQLPRRLEVEVYEKRVGDKDYVFQRCNALFIGDGLTDNSLGSGPIDPRGAI